MYPFKTIIGFLGLAGVTVASPIIDGSTSLSPRICVPPRDAGITPRDTVLPLETELIGDGNPHQNFVYKQVSGTTDCDGNPLGGAAVVNGRTVSWEASAGIGYGFFSGGFDVSVSVETGFENSFGCSGDNNSNPGGSLCVFERIQVTAFTAHTRQCYISACTGKYCDPWSPNYVIYAPNRNQGQCFYDNRQLTQFGIGCRGLDTENDVYNGPAGGPQFIGC